MPAQIREEPGVEITIGSQDNATFWQVSSDVPPLQQTSAAHVRHSIEEARHVNLQAAEALADSLWLV